MSASLSPRSNPRESRKLLLILLTQLRVHWCQGRLLPGEFLVKVGSVRSTADGGEVGWWDLPLVDEIPIDVLEKTSDA